jgi:hypothetical protein
VELLKRIILLLFIILTVSAFSFVLNNFAGLKIFPSHSFTISLNLSNYTETSRVVISISHPNSTFTVIRLDTSKPEHGNIIELTLKTTIIKYYLSITRFPYLVWWRLLGFHLDLGIMLKSVFQ